MQVNHDLNQRLDYIEGLMRRADTLSDALRRAGFTQEADQVGAVAVSLNMAHYDLVEREGPVVIRRAA